MSLSQTLHDIRALFESNGETNDIWYIMVAVVMASLNHPEDIEELYAYLEKTINDSSMDSAEKEPAKVNAVMRLREGLLKSFIAAGFPKVINGLKHLFLVTPESVKSKLPATPLRVANSWKDQRKRGRQLFEKIYDRHTERVLNDMTSYYPDLAQTALDQLYGPILSETSVLSGMETSLVLVTGLKTQDVAAQLRGHAYGALHQGATKQDLARINALVDMLCKYYGLPVPKAKL